MSSSQAWLPGVEERRPARCLGVQPVQEHLVLRIEEGPREAPHLVVEDVALSSGPDLRDQVQDQHGLARSRGAQDDRVLGLGLLG